jgi:hypothetical protein
VIKSIQEGCLDKGSVDKSLLSVDKYTFMWRSGECPTNMQEKLPPNMDIEKRFLQYMD